MKNSLMVRNNQEHNANSKISLSPQQQEAGETFEISDGNLLSRC